MVKSLLKVKEHIQEKSPKSQGKWKPFGILGLKKTNTLVPLLKLNLFHLLQPLQMLINKFLVHFSLAKGIQYLSHTMVAFGSTIGHSIKSHQLRGPIFVIPIVQFGF